MNLRPPFRIPKTLLLLTVVGLGLPGESVPIGGTLLLEERLLLFADLQPLARNRYQKTLTRFCAFAQI